MSINHRPQSLSLIIKRELIDHQVIMTLEREKREVGDVYLQLII